MIMAAMAIEVAAEIMNTRAESRAHDFLSIPCMIPPEILFRQSIVVFYAVACCPSSKYSFSIPTASKSHGVPFMTLRAAIMPISSEWSWLL